MFCLLSVFSCPFYGVKRGAILRAHPRSVPGAGKFRNPPF